MLYLVYSLVTISIQLTGRHDDECEKREEIMPRIRCKEILPDLQMGICTYEADADTEGELVEQMKEHACHVHNIDEIPPDLPARVKKAVKNKRSKK